LAEHNETRCTPSSEHPDCESREERVNFNEQAEFFAEIFCKNGVSSMLEVGCGTEKHAVLLAKRGFA